ncbi:MAG: GTPase Era [Flavobacteriaceae bacterium TMED121]|nr:MAG: GTPase Era [Flavobacteriaceae bacterium TMED121]|tara:strand:+ start:111 stop:1001 length:891 start_codon:yes stop_codon:yes gene_type:complete
MSNTFHKSGYVSIVGNPNVGKSTLVNKLIGRDLTITTPKAQTTRHRILGLINGENYQLVLSDTPGIIDPAYEMQNSMMNFVKESLVDADVLIYMIAVDEDQTRDEKLLDKIKKIKIPLLVLINKIDSSNQKDLESAVSYWSSVFSSAKIIPISALTGFFVEELLQIIIELLPESPAYFPKDQLSDKSERFFVNEAIRKSILQIYDKEVPYAVEVITESFKEEEKIIRIQSVIFVERDTQKGIIIGHKGEQLKRVGTSARKDIQTFFGKKVHLELFVKVEKNWRSNPKQLKRFGYRQ